MIFLLAERYEETRKDDEKQRIGITFKATEKGGNSHKHLILTFFCGSVNYFIDLISLQILWSEQSIFNVIKVMMTMTIWQEFIITCNNNMLQLNLMC